MPRTRLALALAGLLASAPVLAATGDHSGTYDCKGVDAAEGPYTATVTLAAVPAHSQGPWRAYAFTMEVPNFGTYRGEAVARGAQLAIHFGLEDPASTDRGTGLATVTRRAGRTVFTKFYFQPSYKGGNHGTEECVRR